MTCPINHDSECPCLDPSVLPPGVENGCEPIHTWFSQSYASYFVLARSVLQSMPKEWQARLLGLMNELDQRWEGLPDSLEYRVVTVDASLPEFPEDHPLYDVIAYPVVPDPFRDYERGRRRVELKPEPGS